MARTAIQTLFFAATASFPTVGGTDTLYLAKDTNKLYRWTGSVYVELSSTTEIYDTITDPALNAATTTAKIDSYGGTIITTTTTGNDQTIAAPTITTAGKTFVVVNNDTSTDNIDVIDGTGTITVAPGKAQRYVWDGTVWVSIVAIDAGDIAFTPAGNIVATNVQAAIEELDNEKMTNAYPLQQTAFVSKAGNDGTGTVGRVDLPYLTIQGAIDNITDATTNKRYIIEIAPGDYAENIVMKDYVFLKGSETVLTRITGTSGTLITMPANEGRIQEISMILTTAANGSKCIDATSGGIHILRNLDLSIQSSTNGAIVQFADVDCTLFNMAEFSATATMTGTAVGSNIKNYFNINGSTQTSIARFAMIINDGDANDNIIGILDSSTNRVDIIAENIEINCTNVAFSGLAGGYAPFGTGTKENNFQCDTLKLTSSGNGTGYGIYMNSGGAGEAFVRKTNITVTGFTNNYAYFISAGDTLYCFLNLLNAAQGNQINGTLKGLCIDKINDKLTTPFDFETTGAINASGTITGGTLTDGTISITGGNLTGATGITATNLTGTLQTAAQTNITSLGTLTALQVDNININGNTVTSTGNLVLTATDSAMPITIGTGAGDDFTINTTGFVYEGDTGVTSSANFRDGYATTVTAAGTTTLTVSSNKQQFFTGTTTQTIQLPVTSTLVLGHNYNIINNSTGILTINSSGSNKILTLPPGTRTDLVCILTSGTTEASWDYTFYNSDDSSTLELSQQVSVQSMPTGTIEGGVTDFLASGLTLVNSVVNGDFADGTTGWGTTGSGSLVVADNILSDTLSAVGTIFQNLTTSCVTDDVWFVYTKVKRENLAETIELVLRGNTSGTTSISIDSSTTQGSYVELYGKVTVTASLTGLVRPTLVISASTNEIIRVDGTAGVFTINMTAFGISSYTEAQMLDLVRGGYFEGMANTKNIAAKSVGKNLVETTAGFWENGTIDSSGTPIEATTAIRTKNYIKINPSTNIIFSVSASYKATIIIQYDSSKNFISRTIVSTTNNAITTSAITNYVKLVSSTIQIEDFNLLTPQLEISSTATAYESFRYSLFETECELRSVKNATGLTRDTVDAEGNHIKRISDFVAIATATEVNTTNYTDAKNGGYYLVLQDNGIILNGTVGDTETTTDAGDVIYELATQITTNLVTEGKASGIVKSFRYGTMYQNNAYREEILSVASEVTLTEPLSELIQVTYRDESADETIEVPLSDLTLSDDGLTITGLPVAVETYQVKGYLFYNISSLITGEVPVNQGAVIKSINSIAGEQSAQIISLADTLEAINPNYIDGDLETTGGLTTGSQVYITEQAAAATDIAGKGQIWVKNTTPNELWFTDDAGNDHQIDFV